MSEKMVFAYLRASTAQQSCERQALAIEEYAASKRLTISRTFEEKASGKNFERPVYQSMKLTLRRGDTLIIKELDRLGRNMSQIKDEWRELEKLGVDIIVVDNELLNTANKTDLERTLISNVVFELLSYVAQREYTKIKTRQAEGIAIAKGKGVYKGRPPRSVDMDKFAAVYKRWRIDKEITAVKAMELMDLKRDKFYDTVKMYEGKSL
jgi:DNA invertase Pin-like site-specific DNA recombinase